MRPLHGRWRRRLSLLALGALGEGDRQATLAHIAGCGDCRAELAELAATLELAASDPARSAEPPVPLPALVARVKAQLAAGTARPAAPRLRRPAWALAAAVAVAGLALLAVLPRPPAKPADPAVALPPSAAAVQVEVPPEMLRRMERNLTREQTARYLNEAQDVLVTVAARPRRCARADERLDVEEEARRSRELLARRALVVDLEAAEVASARPVLHEVEGMLRDVAALPACARRAELEEIHRELDRRRLLMKIDLMTRELVG